MTDYIDFNSIITRLSDIEETPSPTGTEEIKGYLRKLPAGLLSTQSQAAVQDLTDRVSVLNPEDIHRAKILFQKAHLFRQFLEAHPATDSLLTQEVLDLTFPLIEECTLSTAQSILKTCLELPSLERTPFVHQALPLLTICPEAKKEAVTSYMSRVPFHEREFFSTQALSVITTAHQENNPTIIECLYILTILTPDQRTHFCALLPSWIGDSTHIKNNLRCMQALRGFIYLNKISPESLLLLQITSNWEDKVTLINLIDRFPHTDQADICTLSFAILNNSPPPPYEKIHALLKFAQDHLFPATERAAFMPQFLAFIAGLPDEKTKLRLIEFIPYFAPNDRLSILEMLPPLLATLPLDAEIPFILNSVLSHHPALQEPMYDYLIARLRTETGPLKAKKLAHFILSNPLSFHIFDETHPLAQAALNVIIATETLTDPKNPYVVFKKLVDSAQREVPAAPYQEGVRLDAKQIFITARATIPQTEVLAVTQGTPLTGQVLRNLVIEFRKRITEAPNQLAIQAHIAANNACSWAALLSNLEDPFFSELLDRPTQDEIPLKQARMLSLLKYFLDLSDEVPEGSLLSPREEALCAISTSIQNCAQGKSEGLALTYALLEKKYQYSAESDIDIVAKTKAFVRETLQQAITDELSNDNPMMRAMTGSGGAVKQLSHQSTYVKNLLGPHIGMPHALQLDPHTYTLYNTLLSYSLEEVFALFYTHFTIKTAVAFLKEAFKRLPKAEQKHIFNGIVEILEPRIGTEDLFDIHEETYEPSLTEKAALELLLALGIGEKDPLEQTLCTNLASDFNMEYFATFPEYLKNKIFSSMWRACGKPLDDDPIYGENAFYGRKGLTEDELHAKRIQALHLITDGS